MVEVQNGNRVLTLSYEDFEEQVRAGKITARSLVRFEVVTGEAFVAAGELELFQALADPRQMQFRKNLSRPGVPIVTAILVGVQLRIYLSSLFGEMGPNLQDRFANWAPAILELGESWRLFTYGLLHLGFTHLLFNMCFLAYVGYHLERGLGRLNLLLLYFSGVFFGGLCSIVMAPETPSLGASGGDFGLLAAAVIMGWKYGEIIPPQARRYFGWGLFPYLGFSLVSGLMSTNVDNWSHLGGLLTGIVFMTLMDPEVLPRSRKRNRRIRVTLCGLILSITIGLSFSKNRFLPLTVTENPHGWQYATPSYWLQDWNELDLPTMFSPTGLIEVSHHTRTHERPMGPVLATDRMISRLSSDSTRFELIDRTRAERGELRGERFRIERNWRGQDERIVGLILVRGLFEYQTLVRVRGGEYSNYEHLVSQLLDSIEITEPHRLHRAIESRDAAPEAWSTGLELARVLHDVGLPLRAMVSWNEVLRLQPHSTEALRGWLETQQAYELEDREHAAEIAIERAPEDPLIALLASEILLDFDRREEAMEILRTAWAHSGGDSRIEGAMTRWEMPIPSIEADEITP